MSQTKNLWLVNKWKSIAARVEHINCFVEVEDVCYAFCFAYLSD